MSRVRIVALAAALLWTTACGTPTQGSNTDPEQVDAVEAPELGACRVLTPEDVAQPANASETVDCSEPHTAETFAVGGLPERFADVEYDDKELSTFAFKTCSEAFEKFLGADESLVMRTILTWAWFRPSEDAWNEGARWYRCDVVGGGEDSTEYLDLPTTAKALLADRPDAWMVCVAGATIADEKVTCNRPHEWRAVTTIKVGDPGDEYPGDRVVEVRTRDFCSESVGAWLGYPADYDYGFTWFHEAEWEAGNRRSICWAKTEQ